MWDYEEKYFSATYTGTRKSLFEIVVLLIFAFLPVGEWYMEKVFTFFL
jgi:hypothetical protein